MKYIYQTENDIMVYAASGTGAMGAVTNVVNPGDHVLSRPSATSVLEEADHHVGTEVTRSTTRGAPR
jgi:hypothetical protein